jgi:hypothetical protein
VNKDLLLLEEHFSFTDMYQSTPSANDRKIKKKEKENY